MIKLADIVDGNCLVFKKDIGYLEMLAERMLYLREQRVEYQLCRNEKLFSF